MNKAPVNSSPPLANQYMLKDLRESSNEKAMKLLAIRNFISECKQPLSHIYATIIEIAFQDNWETGFMSLEDFRKYMSLDKEWFHPDTEIQDLAERYKNGETIRYDQLGTLTNMLRNYKVSNKQIHDIIDSILEYTNYKNWPSHLSWYKKAQD